MTNEEILAMEAGREIDALIAEKVMGWKRIDNPDAQWFHDRKWTDLRDRVFWVHHIGVWEADANGYAIFRPSIDLGDALSVLNTFDRREWDITLTSETEDEGKVWGVRLERYGLQAEGILQLGGNVDPLLPTAICRAALIAMISP